MVFWKMAFDMECVTAEQLRGAVITEENKFGEITPAEYKEITKIDFVTQ
ncbi:XkdX family protein [Clostridium sporogenes]